MSLLKKKLKKKSGGDILDIATDSGDFIKQLKDDFKDINKVIGIDITDKNFMEAREKFKDEPVEFIVMDGSELKFENSTFDTVSICAGLHHLDDISGTLSEMKRVLKPGGIFILREMFRDVTNEKRLTDVRQHDWYAKIDRLRGKKHNPTLTKQQIINLVKSLRLKNIEMSERTCDDCPRSIGETVEKEVAEMQEEHAKI
ncbi:MAG: class I SAM-dependent methyltransferase, partial [candidate division Zixibacteria bacterium]|nr:class I SAM-dependent methyltransferase [candidate division Zixibacteria bacterium]